MPRMKPAPSMQEVEFSGLGINTLIETPAGSGDSDAASVASDWSASKRACRYAGAVAADAAVGPLDVSAASAMFATTTRASGESRSRQKGLLGS